MNKRGFTFVEICITLAISLLLTLMVIHAFRGNMGRSRKYVCRGNMKMLYHAAVQYGLDHGLTEGTTVTFDQIHPEYFKGNLPTCPEDDSTFSKNLTIGVAPACPSSSHSWSPNEGIGL